MDLESIFYYGRGCVEREKRIISLYSSNKVIENIKEQIC